VVAIDLPSGLSADSADPIGPSIEAGLTVTLAAPKIPLVLPPAETRAGDIVIADIGIPGDVLENLDGPYLDLLTRASMRDLITPREPDSHKGDYGRVLIVAGSMGKTGAAHLSAIGALRSGAGLVTVATPAACQSIISAMGAEYMTEALHETADGLHPEGVDHVIEMARDVLALGPGLGTAPGTREFIRQLVDRATMPLVVDADGLNAFAQDPDRLNGRSTGEPARDRPQLRGGTSRVRRPEGPSHAHCHTRRQGVHQSHRESRHGHRGDRRHPDRDDRGVARAAPRCRGGLSIGGLSARPGRGSRGSR